MSTEAPLHWRGDLAWALFGLALLLAWDTSRLDLPTMRLFGSASGFAWRDQWLLSDVLHSGGRWLSRALVIVLLLNIFKPLPVIGAMPRFERFAWCAVSIVCALLIAWLKHASRISCPWSLAEFGGTAHYVSHWSPAGWRGAGDGGPGRCFPGGHVSNAFSLLPGWFALRDRNARAARCWLAGVLILGALFGLGQTLRGAHYPSHTLWTAWLCWAGSALLWHVAVLRRQAARPMSNRQPTDTRGLGGN